MVESSVPKLATQYLDRKARSIRGREIRVSEKLKQLYSLRLLLLEVAFRARRHGLYLNSELLIGRAIAEKLEQARRHHFGDLSNRALLVAARMINIRLMNCAEYSTNWE
jgi:hypothetical protein